MLKRPRIDPVQDQRERTIPEEVSVDVELCQGLTELMDRGAFLQIERGRAIVEPRPTLPVLRGWVREIMGLLYVIHNRRLLSMLDSFRRNAPLRR